MSMNVNVLRLWNYGGELNGTDRLITMVGTRVSI